MSLRWWEGVPGGGGTAGGHAGDKAEAAFLAEAWPEPTACQAARGARGGPAQVVGPDGCGQAHLVPTLSGASGPGR